MCGIVGFSGKTNFDKQKINMLLILNAYERGKDSTGLYSPKNDLIKDIEPGPKFLLKHPYQEDNILIAHVRAKTVGLNTIENAHPFAEETIRLVHNGTLKNYYGLARKYNLDYQKYSVDSHIMTGIMGRADDANRFKVLSEIDGAAAVLFTDTRESNVLYAYRNSERPLFKGSIDGNMYISSIKESLQIIGCLNIKEFKQDYLYKIVDGLIQGTPKKIVNKPYVHVYNASNNNTSASTKYTGSNLPSAQQLVGCVLTWNVRWSYYEGQGMDYGQEYEIIGYKDTDLQVIDDYGQKVYVPAYNFNRVEDYISTNDYVKSRYKLSLVEQPDKLAIGKDVNCLVLQDYKDGRVEVLNLETNEKFDVKKSALKRLNASELLLMNCIIDVNDGFGIDVFGSEPINHLNQDNSNENFESESEDEDDEDDDNINFDLQVNEEKLLGDFSYIDKLTDNICKFAVDNIPSNKVEELNELKEELDSFMMECHEYYNVSNNVS